MLATRKGDAGRGKQLLAASVKGELQCLKCHTVRGVGGQVGPDLSMIGKKASRENLFESILYPSKAIADQYVNWNIETKKGLTITGLHRRGDARPSSCCATPTARTRGSTRRTSRARTKSPKSLMPEDIVVYMSEDELIDLVEYLLTLKTPSLTPDAWHDRRPVRQRPRRRRAWTSVFPPEKGIDLKATYDGKSGKVSWRDGQGRTAGATSICRRSTARQPADRVVPVPARSSRRPTRTRRSCSAPTTAASCGSTASWCSQPRARGPRPRSRTRSR